ncbi:hypothetical protein ACPUER_11900 [Burkholderia sp. DN3021]|uniref:hypothetical protein n=1 Tax=Burkholderia sp. DN3021 TaxID=3410137 RepID=UPI003C7E6F01
MTPELALQRGTAAEELLANQAFITCVNELYNQSFAEITGSSLEDTKLRESRFFLLRGLQDITTELQGWVQLKAQILTPTEE